MPLNSHWSYRLAFLDKYLQYTVFAKDGQWINDENFEVFMLKTTWISMMHHLMNESATKVAERPKH